MKHPARDPKYEIDCIGRNAFDFADFTLEPRAADPNQIGVNVCSSAHLRAIDIESTSRPTHPC
jgi:hypothetical protein